MLGESGSDCVGNLPFPNCWEDDIAPFAGQAVLASFEIVVECFVLKQTEFPGESMQLCGGGEGGRLCSAVKIPVQLKNGNYPFSRGFLA